MKIVDCTKDRIDLYDLIQNDRDGVYFIHVGDDDLEHRRFSLFKHMELDIDGGELGEQIIYTAHINDEYLNNKYSIAYVIQLALDWDQEDVFFRGMDFWDNSDEQMKEEAEKAYRFLWAHEHMLTEFNRDGRIKKPKPGDYGTSISSLR